MSKAGVDLDCDTKQHETKSASEADSHGEVTAEALTTRVRDGMTSEEKLDEADHKAIVDAGYRASRQYFAKKVSEYRQQPVDAVYETVCLTSKVSGKDVDVHEMYWADLSRVQSGIFQAVEELYYVLFTVSNIGRMELERSRSLFDKSPWPRLLSCSTLAERILTSGVPLINACLLLLLVFLLPHQFPDAVTVEHWSFLVPMGAVSGLLVGAIRFALSTPSRPAGARGYLWFGGCTGLAAGLILSGLPFLNYLPFIGDLPFIRWLSSPVCIRVVLAMLLWGACFAVLLGLGTKLNKRQPGARRVSRRLGRLVWVVVLYEAICRAPQEKFWAVDIGLATAEWLLFGFGLMWIVYLCAAALCCYLGWRAVCGERESSPRRKAAARIVWTANLAILAPGILFLVLNLGLWQVLFTAKGFLSPNSIPAGFSHKPVGPFANSLQDLVEYDERIEYKKLAKLPRQDGVKVATPTAKVATTPGALSVEASRVPDLLLRHSALLMLVAFGAMVGMLLVAAWTLLPAVLAEGTTESDPTFEYSQQLGNSLSSAWRTWRCWARVLVQGQVFVSIMVCLALIAIHWWSVDSRVYWKYWLIWGSHLALWAVGGLFVALATGVINFAIVRTIVDVAADVANWLRMHPKDNNPTSRIAARYVSLLRYVSQRKETNGDPYYDRVVIFAHSLGSAITADLLLFLKTHPEGQDLFTQTLPGKPNEPRELPVSLFTQGCPLRQLLGLRLPITYGWAWHASKNWHKNESENWQENEEPKRTELLGVKEWVNAYCSGDYVGRHLWHNDVPDQPWKAGGEKSKPDSEAFPRVELCVGAGAHTHYWDPVPPTAGTDLKADSAPSAKVAEELLRLIKGELPP